MMEKHLRPQPRAKQHRGAAGLGCRRRWARPRCRFPGEELPKGESFCRALAEHFGRSRAPELLGGKGGPWEGRGPQLCSRALMNGAFVLAAAARFHVNLGSIQQRRKKTGQLPPPMHPARLPARCLCLGQQ